MLTMFSQHMNSSRLCMTMMDHWGNTELVLSLRVITPANSAYTLIRTKDARK